MKQYDNNEQLKLINTDCILSTGIKLLIDRGFVLNYVLIHGFFCGQECSNRNDGIESVIHLNPENMRSEFLNTFLLPLL